MATSQLYYFFRNSQLGKGSPTGYPIDFESPASNGLKFVLTDEGVTVPDPTTHDYYDDISGASVGGLSAALTSLTVGVVGTPAVGHVDAADLAPAWTSVSGNSVESISLLLDNGGVAANSPLVGYWQDGVTGLPLTPNGGDVNLSFNADGIFKF